ncbi:hypothetical protein TEA_021251 [Camellia sinensis var. sinensis]|uniref:non-specific serine/threonine protein kinase n=1 Tax=Camellia sinensis var. sinensis TaxID=542762 RepID=A0A4S4EF70_CAMSN|nr:hypothetical protein TEA_021251 [Camellia sinensis var. sinensis]
MCSSSFHLVNAQPVDYPIATVSTSWTIINDPPPALVAPDFLWRPILLRRGLRSRFSLVFCCDFAYTACIVGVLIQKQTSIEQDAIADAPQLVWSANRNHPVKLNATLQLTQDGNLTLSDSDGTSVWSTYTGGGNHSVSGLNLTEDGNLVLFDRNNAMVWQSFHHPTDSLLVGQDLVLGRKLTSSTSASNWSQGLFSLAAQFEPPDFYSLSAYVESNPPWSYLQYYSQTNYFKFENESFNGQLIPAASSSAQFIRLDPDGHLKVYEWGGSNWNVVADLLTSHIAIGDCGYPMVCGNYGICSSNGQCGLFSLINNEGRDEIFLTVQKSPTAQYHIPPPTNSPQKKSGQVTIPPPTNSPQKKSGQVTIILGSSFGAFFGVFFVVASCIFLFKKKREFDDFDEFFVDQVPGMPTRFSYEELRAMTNNFNHKLGEGGFGSVFQGTLSDGTNVAVKRLNGFGQVKKSFLAEVQTIGSIHHVNLDQSQVVTTLRGTPGYLAPEWLNSIITEKVDVYSFGVVVLEMLCGRKNLDRSQPEEDMHLLNLFKRKAEEERLNDIVDKYNDEMQLHGAEVVEMMRVAVWCLQSDFSKRPSMSVVVKVLEGSIDVEKNLDYNFTNPAIPRSIAAAGQQEHATSAATTLLFPSALSGPSLGRQSKRKIIMEIAKGLSYLHEECKQKIFHLDIKPQNILLDEYFNAKISDFRLSKLIDKDQSQVLTTLGGTPGNMAPEWSQPEEDMHLLSLFKRKAEKERLIDIIDKGNDEMQLHSTEVVEMMRVAVWCLQNDFSKRPSMSVVVKVLEGSVDVDNNLDYNFRNPVIRRTIANAGQQEDAIGPACTLLSPLALSRPR